MSNVYPSLEKGSMQHEGFPGKSGCCDRSSQRQQKNQKGCIMTQDIIANFFTFSDANGTIQINYYPYARLEYQGPEGNFVYPSGSPGRDNMAVQEQSWLGQQVNVVLVPSVDGASVTLTLLLPSIHMAGQNEQDFDTIAFRTTNSSMLPTTGAKLTYEVISLQGTAQHLLHPIYTCPGSLPD